MTGKLFVIVSNFFLMEDWRVGDVYIVSVNIFRHGDNIFKSQHSFGLNCV
jgi:hypothetical protein